MQAWLKQPTGVMLEPTPRHLDVLVGLLGNTGTEGNLTSDAHLAAISLEHHATVITYDSDFGRFPGITWRAPGAG